jgi:hypothetical protein
LLPLNLGVSGGGPLYSYFALKDLAPILEKRAVKPTIVIEASTLALATDSDSAWSEYEHLFSTVRSRAEILQYFPLLFANFRDYDMSSLFLSTAMFPSLMYRTQSRIMGSSPLAELERMAILGHGKNSFFNGFDDSWGFAPLYGALPASSTYTASNYVAGVAKTKEEFLRLTVALAHEIGARIVLLESSVSFTGAVVPDRVFSKLQEEFSDIAVIRARDCDFRMSDFQDAHVNIWGADRLSAKLLQILGLKGDRHELELKLQAVGEWIPLPDFSKWAVTAGAASPVKDRPDEIEIKAGTDQPRLSAVSPIIHVIPGSEYVLEFEASNSPRRVGVAFGPANAPIWLDSYNATATWTPNRLPGAHTSARLYVRLTPSFPEAVLRLLDYGESNGTHIRLLGLYRQR